MGQASGFTLCTGPQVTATNNNVVIRKKLKKEQLRNFYAQNERVYIKINGYKNFDYFS